MQARRRYSFSRVSSIAPLALLVVVAWPACRAKPAPPPPDAGAASVGASVGSSAPAPPIPCAKDEDCQPRNCCFALAPEACVMRASTRCDAFELKCEPFTAPHYTCACVKGACTGNPAAHVEAEASKVETWATGALTPQVVLEGIMKHGPDVRGCHAQVKKASGQVSMMWTIAPTGKVAKVAVMVSTFAKTGLGACLAKKVGAWRFPKAKGPTRVTYDFRFGR